MTYYKIYLSILICLVIFISCKKETNIDVTVYNYAMGEPVADATVVLLEQSGTTGSGSNASCKVIATATTDNNGHCVFSKEKLSTSSSYQYACNVSNAYGKDQTYTCGQKSSNLLQVGKTNELTLNLSYFEAYIQVQINNVLTPSQSGDSLAIGIATPKYQVPDQPYPFGGGGVTSGVYSTTSSQYPFSTSILWAPQKTNAGKNSVYIRKRKMGVVTVIYDTIKIQPYQTGTYTVNW
jgi:hypothetical protein